MTEARHHNGLVDKKANGLSSSLQHATHWSPTALSYCYFPPPKLKSDTAVVFSDLSFPIGYFLLNPLT